MSKKKINDKLCLELDGKGFTTFLDGFSSIDEMDKEFSKQCKVKKNLAVYMWDDIDLIKRYRFDKEPKVKSFLETVASPTVAKKGGKENGKKIRRT